MSRPYTGNRDLATAARPGTKQLMAWITFLKPGTRNLGIYANRPVRGGQSRSVHATGRAMDIGADRETLGELIEWLYLHRNDFMLEEIHDYIGAWIPTEGFGAGYRCDRDNGGILSGWRIYNKNTLGRGGSWTHIEVAPIMADDPDLVDQTITRLLQAASKETAHETLTTATPGSDSSGVPVKKSSPRVRNRTTGNTGNA